MSSKNATSKRKRVMSPARSDKQNASSQQSQQKLRPIGYLLECDPPVKQFVMYNDSTRHDDKKWVIQDLDETHLLVNRKYKEEIMRKVEEWMDSNVFSSVERVGEDLDAS
mmetsp:Transcript_26907/g.39810  ORF Transcript_26907/g.39810 Transcript_26907/m.39810 type:complete len:110 (-) Transcript_26907:482-811(-)|eukprot:CAMPEP_0194234340 /NCGR_PEP_ID=MMETSP0158-20130606/2085_1 /TAXON_ID=33649 /ORGANISM="Thalassionema nitzschioides, Strain L26-B" /LENGTH=109 /DNA_ID=CAMNT_0038967485 /DNA_START=49 /DNA_END=381 /DNA_ORIENTATION=-